MYLIGVLPSFCCSAAAAAAPQPRYVAYNTEGGQSFRSLQRLLGRILQVDFLNASHRRRMLPMPSPADEELYILTASLAGDTAPLSNEGPA